MVSAIRWQRTSGWRRWKRFYLRNSSDTVNSNGHGWIFLTLESDNKPNETSLPKLEKAWHHPHRPAYRWSRSTSTEGGVTPSTPCPPRKSNKEAANALAAAHDKMEYHRNLHACSKRPCDKGGSDLKCAFASIWTNVRASLDQRPPTFIPKTTKRSRPCANELRVSGFFAPTGSPQCHAPSLSAAPGTGSPSPRTAETTVVSTASWTPPNSGKPSAATSSRLLSLALGTPRSKSRTNPLFFFLDTEEG